MQTKKTQKLESKTSKILEKKVVSKSENKKDTTKKVVVKRRKVELVPTKASAVAIASQASRAKKQALIEKMSINDMPYKKIETSDTRIPLWVWVFFGCSLLLFCVSFYKAIIYPQLDGGNIDGSDNIEFLISGDEDKNIGDKPQNIDNSEGLQNENSEINVVNDLGNNVPKTATDTIEEFFNRLSDHNFDGAFELMIPALRSASEIREHFTSFRMNPFLDGIQGGKLIPTNFQYVNSPDFGKDVYKFDLSYVMVLDQTRYDETWEFTVNTKGDEPKISSIRCVTPKCSYHPIFWPENFGLMR